MQMSFREFMESQAYPKKPGSAAPFQKTDLGTGTQTAGINYYTGATDEDQAKVAPYAGSGVQVGQTVYAGIPSFTVLSMNDKTVTLRIANVGNQVFKRRKGHEPHLDQAPDQERVVTIPRWQYERLITRGLDQQAQAGMGGAPLPPGTGMM